MKPHKHCEVIKAWAEGKEIQCATDEGQWFDTVDPVWYDDLQYRIKPPAARRPETTMSESQCTEAMADGNNLLIDVANAAIAHALETGQVVLPDTENNSQQSA